MSKKLEKKHMKVSWVSKQWQVTKSIKTVENSTSLKILNLQNALSGAVLSQWLQANVSQRDLWTWIISTNLIDLWYLEEKIRTNKWVTLVWTNTKCLDQHTKCLQQFFSYLLLYVKKQKNIFFCHNTRSLPSFGIRNSGQDKLSCHTKKLWTEVVYIFELKNGIQKKQNIENYLLDSVEWWKVAIKELFLFCCFAWRTYPQLQNIGIHMSNRTSFCIGFAAESMS